MHSSTLDTPAPARRVFRRDTPSLDAGAARDTADRTDRLLFAGAVAFFLAYAAFFIYRTSFVIDGERYFSLFDDAMVSMRYARNFAEGHGLVWNPGGERVEGYTNPLWVLYMSLVHLLPVSYSKTSLVVQVTAAALLVLNLYYVRRIALAISGGSRAVACGGVALTASYLPINFWSLQGMEVSVLVLLITFCTWLAIKGMDTGTFHPLLYILLGAGTLIRPDMVILFAAFLCFLFVADSRHRRQHAAWGVLVLTAAIAGQTLFRLWYYGDILPNTYYLKMTGVPVIVRITRGVYVLLQFVWRANPLFFLITAVLAFRRNRRIWLLFWTLASQMAYSVYVGGDAWEYWGGSNRYISIVMPGFFALLSYALYLVAVALGDTVRVNRQARFASFSASRWIYGASVLFAIVSLNSIHGLGALAEAALIRPPLHTGHGAGNYQDVEEALLLRRATTPEASIAVVRAGTIPYFADRYTIDLLGKNDANIARGPVNVPSGGRLGFREFRPGHMKFDFAHSIGHLQPDVIVHLRRRTALAKPFLDAGQYTDVLLAERCVFARRESPRVLWDRLPGRGCGSFDDTAADPARP
jgi:hypothetical protein